ncbi:MAG TPA: hypothetical protein VFX70_17860 [Mycobacteriales bacterium]|nr:hypothetical protein [Mycobacteriales bacterium]
MTSPVRTPGVRRRALARVGALAAVLVVAGGLPWLAGSTLAVRLIGLPLLAAGLLVGLVGIVGYRLPHAVPSVPTTRDAPGCTGCGCGAGGCGTPAADPGTGYPPWRNRP